MGTKPTLGQRYARLGTWGMVAFLFYYVCTGLNLFVFLILGAAVPLFFALPALVLLATAALFWRLDRAAFALGIASVVVEVASLGALLAVGWVGLFFAPSPRGADYQLMSQMLAELLGALALALAVYCGLAAAFFVRFRPVFFLTVPGREQEAWKERPAPPPEDPWAL